MNYIRVLLPSLLAVLIPYGYADAKTVEFCNASPLLVSAAIGVPNQSNKVATNGWYNLDPGECRNWEVSGEHFYYMADAYGALEDWLDDGDDIDWTGWNRFCVHPSSAFNDILGEGQCETKRGFKKVNLINDRTIIYLYHENHDYSAAPRADQLSQAIEDRRKLTGRMKFENLLRSTEGREAPFSLGAHIYNAQNDEGVIIKSVQAGMAAEEIGLQTGDRIVALNGYKVRHSGDIFNILDGIYILHKDPVRIGIISVYDGKRYDPLIVPNFFPFNHKEYDNFLERWGTPGTSLLDNVTFGQSSEIMCGAGYLVSESFSWLFDDGFDGDKVADGTSSCSENLDEMHEISQILYKEQYVAGEYASWIVPVPLFPAGKIGKLSKAAKTVPLAGRSRKVSRPPAVPSVSRPNTR